MANIPIYQGNSPYIFISYAHANSPAVMQVVEELTDRGFRVWYDDGIEVGSEWPEYIAQHLADAGIMIAFLSNAYMRSDNCRKEMHFALNRKIPIINIFLEETAMTPGMEMQIGSLFALMKYCMSDAVFEEKLFAAPQLDAALLAEGGEAKAPPRVRKPKPAVPVDLTKEAKKQKKKKVRRFSSLGILLSVLIACAVFFIIAWSSGLLSHLVFRRDLPEPTVLPGSTVIRWTEPMFEQAARDYSGITDGDVHVSDLTGLTSLVLRGNAWSFSAELLPEPTSAGSVADLSDLRYFPDLHFLLLEDQAFSDLESMPACGLETLVIWDCGITSLQGVGQLPYLRDLIVASCPLRDLGDLQYCLELRKLSLPDCNVRNLSAVHSLIKLAEVELSGFSLHELRPAMRQGTLTDVTLHSCDLRGRFFYRFDSERSIVSLSLVDCELNSTKNLDDFTGLTTLTLIRSGENLDWSELAALPRLKTVYCDSSMESTLQAALQGSGISVSTVDFEP